MRFGVKRIIFLVYLLAGAFHLAEAREWEDKAGNVIEAEFVGMENGWVQLAVESNRTMRVHFQNLSRPDQNYARQRAADLAAERLVGSLEKMTQPEEPVREYSEESEEALSGSAVGSRASKLATRRAMAANADTASRDRKTILETLRLIERESARGSESEKATAVLNAYRYLCGLAWDVTTDAGLEEISEAGARLCEAIGHLDHTPKNPGWKEDEYKLGYRGTSQGNLFAGGGGAVSSVHAYMNDSGGTNLQALGHRRWCLNPSMQKTGFGTSGNYSCMHAFDGSRKKVPDWDMVAFPAAGFFPSAYFGQMYAWSVTLNPDTFRPPESLEPGQVRVFRVFDSGKLGKEMELVYVGVDRAGYGVSNCIIFLPRDVALDNGKRYRVEISGIKKKSGKTVTLAYEVEFIRS